MSEHTWGDHGSRVALLEAHHWVPGLDYFGPIWVDHVGWVVPHGWEPPHGWCPPHGWHEPTRWHHDHYRHWCHEHHRPDHDWRGWEHACGNHNSHHWVPDHHYFGPIYVPHVGWVEKNRSGAAAPVRRKRA